MTTDVILVDASMVSESEMSELVEDCRAILVEGKFAARWALVETYHALGKRLLEERPISRADTYGRHIVTRVSQLLNISERSIYRAIAFATKFPDLALLPFGKDVSWRRVVNELLPAEHASIVRERKCPACGYVLTGKKNV